MNTPSHFILHACIRKYYKNTKSFQIPRSFLLGSIAPDILLFLLVFLYIPLSVYFLGNSMEYTFRHMFDTLYFKHPLWMFGYNILHSPTTLFIFFMLLVLGKRFLGERYRVVKWFFFGCALHSLFDIPLHHDDGPKIFYPFSDYRFTSPVSYWDTRYYANIVAPIELLLFLSGIIYLFFDTIKNWLE